MFLFSEDLSEQYKEFFLMTLLDSRVLLDIIENVRVLQLKKFIQLLLHQKSVTLFKELLGDNDPDFVE